MKLSIYNTLSREKEIFEPLNPPFVGMYVCGPTVYGDPHLGHARPAITFDLVFRYLKHLGYRVRYVRNITDVGHLEADRDFGEDKISRKARLEQLEPMEVVQMYTNEYRLKMIQLNVLPPSIEPSASGHIIEQQALVEKILENGFAYEKKGSVYFDVEKYARDHQYGKLSGRKIEDLLANTRELEKQQEKNNPLDFAIWKNADPEHLMRWPSRWGEGFPGWHVECSVMSSKYLGAEFDIHGGGMDLLFPHHECEIAQTVAGYGKEAVRYWMHNNMVTLNGQKMGKSLGNAVSLNDFFSGDHKLLDEAYSPMTIRFFLLQAHYRSTVDFSNEALKASQKGLKKLLQAAETLQKIKPAGTSTVNISALKENCYKAMNDDFNSPVLIAHLFEGVKIINAVNDGKEQISETDLEQLKVIFKTFVFEILGLQSEEQASDTDEMVDSLMNTILSIRQQARENKDYATSDKIRDELGKLNIRIMDTKDGAEWEH